MDHGFFALGGHGQPPRTGVIGGPEYDFTATDITRHAAARNVFETAPVRVSPPAPSGLESPSTAPEFGENAFHIWTRGDSG
jgi:hypothetical protein